MAELVAVGSGFSSGSAALFATVDLAPASGSGSTSGSASLIETELISVSVPDLKTSTPTARVDATAPAPASGLVAAALDALPDSAIAAAVAELVLSLPAVSATVPPTIRPTRDRWRVPTGGRGWRIRRTGDVTSKEAAERVVKPSGETRLPVFDFRDELASGETLVAVNSLTVTPSGALVADQQTVLGTEVQVRLTGGAQPQRFASDGATVLVTGHGLLVGHTIRFAPDEDAAIPSGVQPEKTYHVVELVDANTFKVSDKPSGEVVTLGTGDGWIYREYRVSVSVNTTSGQILEGDGLVDLR